MSSPRSCSSSDTSSGSDRKRKKSSYKHQYEQASEPKREKRLPMEDFPVDSPNPFEQEFCASDVVLIVEGKKLHTHKLILSLYSSYFRLLLGSQDFAEASAKEIELKGDLFVNINYNPMVTFLRYLYPVHCCDPIPDDTVLMELFSLSEYFQCQHVRAKCEAYLQQQMDRLGTTPINSTQIAAERACLYLWLCEKYEVKKFVEQLVGALCRKQLSYIEHNYCYKALSPEMRSDVHMGRVRFLEQKLTNQRVGITFNTYPTTRLSDIECRRCRDISKRDTVALCRKCHDEYMTGFQQTF